MLHVPSLQHGQELFILRIINSYSNHIHGLWDGIRDWGLVGFNCEFVKGEGSLSVW